MSLIHKTAQVGVMLLGTLLVGASFAVLPQPRFAEGDLPGKSLGVLKISVPGATSSGGNAEIRIWTRDERLDDAVWVFCGNSPVPNDLVTFGVSTNTDGVLEGSITFEADDHYHYLRLSLPVSPNPGQGSAVVKTVRLGRNDTSSVEKNAQASFVSIDEMKTSQTALPDSIAWPSWYGPHFTMRDQWTESEIVTSWDDVVPVWRSEAVTPAGLGSISRQSGDAHKHAMGGGMASLVSSYGNVYMFHHDPAGTVYDTAIISSLDSILRWYESEFGPEAAQTERNRWLISADDVVLCIDGETGHTRWRTVYEEKGANWQGHKGGYNNLTPCIGDGKIFVIGSTYRTYCLDAETGDSLWESNLGSAHDQLESRKQQYLQENELGNPFFSTSRAVRGACVYVNGRFLAHDYNGGIRAFDANTGGIAWETGDIDMPESTPAVWTHEGVQYVLACGKDRVVCFAADDGAEKWSVACPGAGGTGISVADGYMAVLTYVKDRTPSEEHLVWFRLRSDGAEKTGEVPRPETASAFVAPIVNGYMYYGSRDTTRVVNLESGDIVGEIAGNHYGIARAGHYQVMRDRLIIQHDGRHGGSRMVMAYLDPTDFRVVSPEEWDPPHWTTSSYVIGEIHPLVDGRMFLRGSDGVYCYDFRTESSSALRHDNIGQPVSDFAPMVHSGPNGGLHVESNGDVAWSLMTVAGRTIRQGAGRGVLKIDTRKVSPGCYILQLRDLKTQKTVRRRWFASRN